MFVQKIIDENGMEKDYLGFRLQNGMRIVFSEDISKGCVFADDAFEKLDKAIKILNEVFYDLVDPEEEEND